MGPTRAAQAERTRTAVVETARQLFLERGYDATSLQQIADTMGITKANVYYYFRTKDALLDALLTPMADDIEALLDAAAALPPVARTTFLVSGFVERVVTAFRTVGSLNLGDPALRRHVAATRRLDELAARAVSLLFGADPTPDQLAAYWVVNDLGPVLRRLGHLPDEELRATLVRLCLRVLP